MKFRESGMPYEGQWSKYFEPKQVLEKLGINGDIKTLIDVGCGYGTFLFPAAEVIKYKAIGIDIDEAMIEVCKKKAEELDIKNVDLICGDISKDETLIVLKAKAGAIDCALLFNILHCEEPGKLLYNVYNILDAKGRAGVIHWKYEETPRGPSMDIRPTYKAVIDWARGAGFSLEKHVDLPPYHFGLVFVKV